jgi:hypothetical protein
MTTISQVWIFVKKKIITEEVKKKMKGWYIPGNGFGHRSD